VQPAVSVRTLGSRTAADTQRYLTMPVVHRSGGGHRGRTPVRLRGPPIRGTASNSQPGWPAEPHREVHAPARVTLGPRGPGDVRAGSPAKGSVWAPHKLRKGLCNRCLLLQHSVNGPLCAGDRRSIQAKSAQFGQWVQTVDPTGRFSCWISPFHPIRMAGAQASRWLLPPQWREGIFRSAQMRTP